MREVSTQAFASARADGAVAIDVREPGEYLAGHVPGARLMPMGEVAAGAAELPRDTPVFVICANGNRSLTIADLLIRRGYDARSVRGGTSAWESAGYPVVRGAHSDVA
ncbi:MAG TPA: rhodanese-like domain-containing protein [Nocardioidaceae bacterium]|nr:rhodanese-like domain-containing protein [Nocardioidaceae bacterium]